MKYQYIPWALAKGSRDGRSLMMRYRQFSEEFPKQDYPVRVNVVCYLEDQTPSGLPTRMEYARLDSVEDSLMELAEVDESSVLAMVITSSGQREFIFQTSNANELCRRVSKAYSGDPVRKLNVVQESKDDWDMFFQYIPKN